MNKFIVIIWGGDSFSRRAVIKTFQDLFGDDMLEIRFDEFKGQFGRDNVDDLCKEKEKILILTDIEIIDLYEKTCFRQYFNERKLPIIEIDLRDVLPMAPPCKYRMRLINYINKVKDKVNNSK